MATRRSDGRWMARVRVAGHRYTFYGPTRPEADARACEFARRMSAAEAAAGTVSGVKTGEYLKSWLVAKDIRSLDRYEAVVRLHLQPLRAVPLDLLTHNIVQGCIDQVPAGTRRKTLTVLRSALSDAVRHDLLPSNPAALVRTPKDQRKSRVLAHAEATTFIDGAVRLRSLYVYALGTGARLGELLAAAPVDIRDGALTVRGGKTENARRLIPLPAAVQALSVGLGPLIFQTDHGTPLDRWAVRRDIHQVCSRAGVEPFRFHDLRHTYATWLLRAATPMHVVSRLLGHSSIQTTIDTYGHVQPTFDDVRVLDAWLQPPAGVNMD